jgi:hypothetical protein
VRPWSPRGSTCIVTRDLKGNEGLAIDERPADDWVLLKQTENRRYEAGLSSISCTKYRDYLGLSGSYEFGKAFKLDPSS